VSLAAKVLEEIEKNAELRRKFFRILLADLMLDPDLRLAIVNAMIREVVTKADLAEMEKRVTTSIEDLGKNIATSLENLLLRGPIKEFSSKIETITRDVEEFRGTIGVIESIGERFDKVEDKVDMVKGKMEALESTLSNLASKLDDSISRIGSTTTTLQERAHATEGRISRLATMVFIIMVLTLIAMIAQVLELLKVIP